MNKIDLEIPAAINHADPLILRTILYQLTEDPKYLKMSSGTVPFMGGAFSIPVLDESYTEELKADMLQVLTRLRGEGNAPDTFPTRERLERLMDLCAGRQMPEMQHEIGLSELGVGDLTRRVEWRRKPEAADLQDFRVLVIGAGLGGIAAGVQLGQLGIPYTVVEREAGVGGTWWRARYPDARVDVPSHHYSYAFEPHYPWRHHFAEQAELVEYFEHCARKYGVLENIRFKVEVTRAVWDEAAQVWEVTLKEESGRERLVRANAIISATGLFNRVSQPSLPGMEQFEGKIVHTAEWDSHYDHNNKRIALIGTGSSGMQTAPRLAKDASHLTIFQRTPSWVFHVPNYREPISRELRWLFENVPFYENWYRFRQYAGYFGDVGGLHLVDPAWKKAGSFNQINENIRESLLSYYEAKIGHRPDLMQKCVPEYGPFTTRPVLDNGWFDALLQANVELVTEPIERFTAKGIRTTDAREREVDLVVLASGYQTSEFLWPMHIVGRGGLSLDEAWKADGARALYGITIPAFPNLFCLYGPNTNPKTGAIFLWEELQVAYALYCIRETIENNFSSIEARADVCDLYNRRMDEKLKTQIWFTGKKSYYRNRFGRVDVNMPWNPDDYYRWIAKPDFDEFTFSSQAIRRIEQQGPGLNSVEPVSSAQPTGVPGLV